MSRFVIAGAWSALFCLVFATAVFVTLDPVRIRPLPAPVDSVSGVVRLDVRDVRLTRLGPVAAVIARVRPAAGAHPMSIVIGGSEVCARDISGGGPRRVDCAWTVAGARPEAVEVIVRGPTTPWTLEAFELATHHGSNSGLMNLFVLPAHSAPAARLHPGWLMILWPALTGMFLLPAPEAARRWPGRAIAPAAAAVMCLALVLPWISPYRVVMSPLACAAVAGLALAQRMWLAACAGQPHAEHVRVAMAFALAVAIVALGVVRGTRAVAVADSYGYASQADLWLEGELRTDQSFALAAPWPDAARTFAPVGYRPSPADSRLIVPIYPPGLSLLLAGAKWLGGQRALFVVVPVCAGLLVLATYGLGRRLAGGAAGLAAAWLVATSPTVIAYTMVVMTDVPVAAAWTWALFLLTGSGARSAFGAGLLAGVAVLIRPNLVPLAAVLGAYYLAGIRRPGPERRTGIRSLVAFAGGAAPLGLVVALLHTHLYGSPFESGYGPLAGLFDVSRAPLNLHLYLSWFAQTHTVLALVGLAAVLVPLRWIWPRVRDRRTLAVLTAFVVLLWIVYAGWMVFDTWLYTRFLLSSWPVIMIGVGAVAVSLARMRRVGGWAVVLVVLLGLANVNTNAEYGTLSAGRVDERSVSAARFARALLPPNAIVVTERHSGTLRYYSGIATLNHVWLEPAWLDRSVDWLRARGLRVYALFDERELAAFRRRFARTATFAAVERYPLGVLTGPDTITLYELGAPAPARPVVIADERFAPRDVVVPVRFVAPVFPPGDPLPNRVP
jgi:hypothetical protein